MITSRGGAVLLVCGLAAIACSPGPEPPAGAGDAAVDAIELVPISHAEWQRKLAGYPPDIVVVDMWATWCTPCIERFPKMVELHARYASQGVRFVSMNLDDREDTAAIAQARDFLVAQQARFENYLMNENIIDAFEKLDLLGIPAVLVYDRDASLRHRLTGDDPRRQFTDEDIERAVRELLAEPSDAI